MIAEIGNASLILALAVAFVLALLPAYGYFANDVRAIASARTAAMVQFGLILISYICLTTSFLNADFSVAYVAANSHSELPIIYRISAVWGAHEGSLLLWILMLTVWTLAVALKQKKLPPNIGALVLATLGAISIGFLMFTIFTSNPFERHFPIPLDGRDLNPLLQDPGLIIHPPMLYLGYVGFSVAFAFAVAALIDGRMDTAWVRWTRPWTTAAWVFLTIGITLGSWWAYHELGWGGWWFWDPVENASFMPWLIGTALIHSLAVTEKRGILKSWTILLALMAFSLSLLGTFLVRSGVLISVHAFATDPARGVFILAFLAVVIGGSLALYTWRAPKLVSQQSFALFSREGLLLLNNVFLATAAAAVLLGTLYPLIVDALGLGKISVGPPYFNAVFLPLTAPLAFLVAFATIVNWKKGDIETVKQRLMWPLIAAVMFAILLPLVLLREFSWMALGGVFLGGWAMISSLQELIKRRISGQKFLAIPANIWGQTLAHFGLGVFVVGVTVVSIFSVERDVRLAPGQSVELSGYEFTLHSVKSVAGPNYDADRGTVTIERNGKLVSTLSPEKRLYRVQRNVMTDADVDHTPLRDLYASLGEPFDNGDWSLRVYHKPLMRWVWGGAFILAFGGLIALFDKRYRLKIKTRPLTPVSPTQ